MQVNYFGSLYVVRAALPAMRARRQGRIVFISSGAGLMGLFGYSPYAPAKFALRGLAEGLRAELQADNVGVSIAYPPDTDTPMLAEENKTKPEETKLMTGVVKTWSAHAVASCIMRGIKRGKFAITPGAAIMRHDAHARHRACRSCTGIATGSPPACATSAPAASPASRSRRPRRSADR